MPTQDDVTKVQTWLDDKLAGGLTCPICHQKSFNVHDVIAAPTLQDGTFAISAPTVPMVPVVCLNCTHIILFAAGPLGLVSA